MQIDLSLRVSRKFYESASDNERMTSFGHVGTHFDVMDKHFPFEYTKRRGIVFDVSNVISRDIEVTDIDITLLKLHITKVSGFLGTKKRL